MRSGSKQSQISRMHDLIIDRDEACIFRVLNANFEVPYLLLFACRFNNRQMSV